jgi:HD-GYP domain-containing protein (c-di-GMP phosphodiesterase class II)
MLPLAKLVGACDTFAAMAAPRPHRAALLPFAALEETMLQASRGMLERPYTRALATVCGLFPVSSWVRLSDETIGRVVGSHESMIDRPLVRRYVGGVAGEVVDLAPMKPWELSVLECVDPEGVIGAR